MKLLSKYHRTNILATVIVVLLSSVLYYFVIHYVLLTQLDSALKVEEQEVNDFVKKNGHLPAPSLYHDQEVYYQASNDQRESRKFRTIDLFDTRHNEHVPIRQLSYPINIQGKNFLVVIKKSQEETEDLIQLILGITLIVVLLLLIIIFLVNRFVLHQLWKPFDSTILQLKRI